MLNSDKLNNINTKIEMNDDSKDDRESSEDQGYTFKVTKRRSPWSHEVSESLKHFHIGRRSYNDLSKKVRHRELDFDSKRNVEGLRIQKPKWEAM